MDIPANTDEDNEAIEGIADSAATIVECGIKGDIYILFPKEHVLEVWGWTPHTTTGQYGDAVYLHHQFKVKAPSVNPPTYKFNGSKVMESPEPNPSRTIEKFVLCEILKDPFFVFIVKDETKDFPYSIEIHEQARNMVNTNVIQVLSIPPFMQRKNTNNASPQFKLKVRKSYMLLGNSEGFIYVYKSESFNPPKYNMGNHDFKLQTTRKHCCQPLVAKHGLSKVIDEEMFFQTSCFEDEPLFDIVGDWLVYSPTKYEYNLINAVIKSSSDKPMVVKNDDVDPLAMPREDVLLSSPDMFTPVKLPPPGPVLNTVLSTLSKTALDGLFKISEASSNKLKDYLNSEKTPTEQSSGEERNMVQQLNSFGRSFGKLLYSTASSTAATIHKSTMHLVPNDNQLIKIVDLKSDKVMCLFKPPGGVSNLSISPYDLQMVHSSYRGDLFYMWDLFKLPKEVSLTGKFVRGKTSASVKNIFWFINNYDGNNLIKGLNSGFGCITKSSGSIHWYNINYLLGNSNNNYPNRLRTTGAEVTKNTSKSAFIDSWILSEHASKFLTVPNAADMLDCNASPHEVGQMAVIDDMNTLKLISPLNGSYLFKYELPIVPVDSSAVPTTLPIALPIETDKATDAPLSQSEIETCGPYLNLISNKNVELATYDFDNDDVEDFDQLQSLFKTIGPDIPTRAIHFEKHEQDANDEQEATVLADEIHQGLVFNEENVERLET